MRQVVRFHSLAEQLAVAHDATHRNAAEVHAVVTLHPPDQPGFVPCPGTPIGAGHFQGRVGRLRARSGEEHMAQPCWHALHNLVGQLERQRVAELERRGIVQRGHLLLRHGTGNFTPVPQARTPQARETVKNLLAVDVGIRAFGAGHDARIRLELAVAGIGHPVRFQPGRIGAGESALVRVTECAGCRSCPCLTPRNVDAEKRDCWALFACVTANIRSFSCINLQLNNHHDHTAKKRAVLGQISDADIRLLRVFRPLWTAAA